MAKIFLNGLVGNFEGELHFTLVDVIAMVEKLPKEEPLTVQIESYGGYVDEGHSIANYLKSLKRNITTISMRQLASIAVSIYLTGTQRLIGANHEGIIIHNPFGAIEGDADELKKYSEEVQAEEDAISKEYAKATGIDASVIDSLLKSETKLGAQKAIELHFATGIAPEIQAMAKLKTNKQNNMENKELIEKLDKNTGALTKLLEKIQNAFKPSIKNMEFTDATGVKFTVEREDENIQVGDKITPEAGKFVLADGRTIVAEGGLVKEIIPASNGENAELENLKKANVDLTAELAALKADIASKTQDLDAKDVLIKDTVKEMETLKADMTAIRSQFTPEKPKPGTEDPKDGFEDLQKKYNEYKNKKK